MKNNKNYNKNLKIFARENRKQMTQAEVYIWENILRRKQLYNLKFLRQRPIDNYIVDFMCKEINLIIEIDGLTHSFEEVFQNDLIREKKLIELGFKIIRFNDEEVLKDLDNVFRVLENFLINNGIIDFKKSPT